MAGWLRYLRSMAKSTVEDYIRQTCPVQSRVCQEVLQASFASESKGDSDLKNIMSIGSGGIVDVSVGAYNRHHHLVLRYVRLLRPLTCLSHPFRYMYTDPKMYG
jgi:hypothetical protein